MSFLFPLALLGLLAIPALIIIYILRNKYKEETAPSTYIWEVAAKLLKRKNPLSKFEHLLALIVQCLAIAVFSIALAHPVFSLKEAADDMVFILDASASMSMVSGEQTRFEKGVEAIREKASEAENGSTFTLILADKEVRTVCQNVDDFSRFELYLDSAKPSEFTSTLNDSVVEAQKMFSERKATKCFLVTDQKPVETTSEDASKTLEYIYCGDEEENFAITSLSYKTPKNTSGKIEISGTAYSYTSDHELEVVFYVDNGIEGGYKEIGKQTIQVTKGLPYAFSSGNLTYTDTRIAAVKAVITQTDGMMDDNSYTVFVNNTTVNTSALIISSQPTFLQAIFNALGVSNKVVSPTSYRNDGAGYNIYVFDNYTPSEIPEDGASMFFGLSKSIDLLGFKVNEQVACDFGSTVAWSTDETNPLVGTLTRGIGMNRTINIERYWSYALLGDFTTIMTVDRKPACFVGRTTDGLSREVVFSFDLHNTDLPLIYDFVPLMRNLVDYCNPKTLTTFDFTVGESATLNIADDVERIVLTKPDGTKETIDYEDKEQYIYETKNVGEHTLTVTYSDERTKEINFFVSMDEAEENTQLNPIAFSIAEPENMTRADGILDNLLPIIIAAAAFFAADWILYTYEQY